MEFWEKIKYKSGHDQFTFHFVCCKKFAEELERIEQVYFADFNRRERAQVVNGLLRVLEPYLRHHLNLEWVSWDLNLKAGEAVLPDAERACEVIVMDHELWVQLDGAVYRLLKKLHEGVDSVRGGTFSMALVLRAALLRCFGLLDLLGRDGLLLWVKEWLKEHAKRNVPRYREEWKPLEQHIGFYESKNVKYIGLYGETYRQIHLYHPPPGPETT